MTEIFDHAERLVETAHRAGKAIMAHYGNAPTVERKDDESPVTAADREAEAIILADLADIVPQIPVISEEAASEGSIPEVAERFLLVDPLDGTKEFINERTDFTVNIALIEDGVPTFGLIYAPARSALYLTRSRGETAYAKLAPEDSFDPTGLSSVQTRNPDPSGLTAVMSRSHLNAETKAFLEKYTVTDSAQAGSSLKFCVLAEGSADVYPRLARTMEWDTAAGDAILRTAGGTVQDLNGGPLRYGKADEGFANAGFVAWGRAPIE